MRPIDVRNLIRFNTKMSMFICPFNQSNVESFLHGYEYGTANECRFTEVLGKHLAGKYDIKATSLGWTHQVSRFADLRSLDWMEAYLLVSSEVLNAALEVTEAEN